MPAGRFLAYSAEGTVISVSAMSRRGFSLASESESEFGLGLEACSTSEPGKCPPVVSAVMPGMISVGSEGSKRLELQ